MAVKDPARCFDFKLDEVLGGIMKGQRIIILIVISFLVFFSVLSTLLNAGLIQIRLPWLESFSKIRTNRELTDREQFLAERLSNVITEMVIIQDCEVAVLLDEPFYHVVVDIKLLGNTTFPDSDRQAVLAIICNTMSSENVNISDENISLVVGWSE